MMYMALDGWDIKSKKYFTEDDMFLFYGQSSPFELSKQSKTEEKNNNYTRSSYVVLLSCSSFRHDQQMFLI